jgi:hypothetical protein
MAMKAMLILLAGTLAGCQSWQSSTPDHKPPPPHRGAGTGAGFAGSAGQTGSGIGEKEAASSLYGMCAMNQEIMNARTPEARQAILERDMPNMSQEMREQHLEMMRRECQ